MRYSRLVLISIALAVSAGAESTFKDGPHLAYPRGGDIRDSELGFGWQITYERSDYWSLDLSLTRQTDTLDDIGVLAPPFQDRFDLEMVSAVASLRLSYPIRLTTLYAGGGLGYYYLRTDNKVANRSLAAQANTLPAGVQSARVSVNPDNKMGYHAAVGIEQMLTSRWELFAEYRWVWLDTTLKINRVESRGGLQQETTRTRSSFTYDHGLIRAGVNYRF